MNTFNKEMNFIESPDLGKGHLTEKTIELTWNYVLESEEEGHWEVIAEYPDTGGKDVEWAIDVPEVGHWDAKYKDGKPVDMEHYDGDEQPDESWDKTTVCTTTWTYQLYTPYTKEELEQIAAENAENERLNQIADYKAKLANTDYILTKMVEYNVSNTPMPEEDAARYAEIINQRAEWRAEINRLEGEVANDA